MARVTAMSSIAYAHYTLLEALPRMAARGYRRVEVGSFGNYCYHFNYGSPSPSELKQMLTDMGLQAAALNWSFTTGQAYDRSTIPEWLESYRRRMDGALEVAFPMMTMHFGPINDRDDLPEQRKVATEVYRELAEYALSCGMKMLLELPHLHLVHQDCESVCALLDELDLPNVGLLLDSSHWGVIGYDLDAFLERVGDRLWHVHLRDSSPETDLERDRKFLRPPLLSKATYNLTLTPGLGVVDFAQLGSALDRIGYEGDVTTEFEYFDMHLDEIERQYDAGLTHLMDCGWELPEGLLCDCAQRA